ncbi:MAG: PH domain-containing protein [Balneolaceae bacterium]
MQNQNQHNQRKAARIHEATFEPRIKKYFFWSGILILAVTVVGIILIPIWAIAGRMYINKYYDALFCELTTRALSFRKGVLFKTERTVPLDKIQDLTFKEGPVLRYFGLSSLYIETAGQSAQQSSDMTLIGIVDAHKFRAMVMDQRDNVTDHQSNSTSSEDSEHSLAPILKEINENLKKIENKLTNN